MPRVPYKSRAELAAEGQAVYDRIAATRGAVGHVFQALLNSPGAAGALAGLGEYLRYSSPLDPVVRETAILSAAREMGNQYEWTHHEPVARRVGVRDEVIEAIRAGRAPMGLPAKEGVFAQAAKELVRTGTLTERTFQAVLHLLEPRDTVELVVLVGYYSMVGRAIAALGVGLEEGLEPGLPG